MPVDIILGLQWGDEGKGKIVDLLANRYSTIARFQGGPNAGHTIIIGDKKFVLHQIPSGMTRENIVNVIGNGVILDPVILRQEIQRLEEAGIDVRSRLLISRRANLILPTHRLLDSVSESRKGEAKIGSTLKGIGPAYQDKVGRSGLRTGDIFSPDFETMYRSRIDYHKQILEAMGSDAQVNDAEWLDAIHYMRQLQFIDTEYYFRDELKANKHILAEGAQGTLLDIDYGSYPYVTSSNTITASVCTGLGISPKQIGKVYGIFKAYCTRVGGGPFPTELLDETGEFLRRQGNEFGSTTGRPRRCGWLDLAALNYAIMLNGVDELFMMKLDVMKGLEEVKVCTGYEGGDFSDLSFNGALTPVYETVPGWTEDVCSARERSDFPEAVKKYLHFIEENTGRPITLISTGPERNQTIITNP